MAESIVAGLFGLTPYQVQQQRMAQGDQSAANFAQLDPFQRASYGLYKGAGMLAGAGAEAMGMVDPAVQEAQQRQTALQGLDVRSPESIMQRAMQIQDPRLKTQLVMLAQQRQAEIDKSKLVQAQTEKALRPPSTGGGTPADIQIAESIADKKFTRGTSEWNDEYVKQLEGRKSGSKGKYGSMDVPISETMQQKYRTNPDGTVDMTMPIGKPRPISASTKKLELTGSRESVQIQRVILAINQVEKDASNISKLPITTTRGILGGREQEKSLFEATKETLANTVTGQEAQTYNVMATGIQRNLAAIEAAGLMPSGALTRQMDAVIIKEGDTNLTKLQKLAQIRQIAEAGLETILSNPRVSESQKEHMREINKKLKESIPFTQEQLLALPAIQNANPKATLRDVMKGEKESEKYEYRTLPNGKVQRRLKSG